MCLGRSRQLEDIYIKGKLDKEGIHASPEALEETKRLQAIFDENISKLNEQAERYWKISYLNVRSLNGNKENVRQDNFLMASDVFGLGETWQKPGEEKHFAGFEGVFSSHGKGKGVAAFTTSTVNSTHLNSFASDKFSAIHLHTVKFDIIFVYLSAGCNKEEIFSQLESWIERERPTTIMGDFNIEYQKGDKLIKSLEKIGFAQMMRESTCDTGSLIDHIYVNEALKSLGISTQRDSAYYSDHDIITINIQK